MPAALPDDPGLGPPDLAWPGEAGAWSGRGMAAATWGLVAVGVLARSVRYASNYPLWGDEASLAANLLGRGYRELLGSLEYGQVSPPLFLWVELAATRAFGFSEYALRLFPFLCGVASVFLFRHVASRLLRGAPLVLAVGVFAVAFHPIRHAADVKPYASDLLASMVLLAMAVEWWRAPARSGWLWALAAAVPAALGLSQPAAFVAAGIGLALLAPAWGTGRSAVRLALAAYLAMLALGSLGLLAHATSQCRAGAMEGMRAYWAASFPPLDSPSRLVGWLAWAHTGSMFAYPDGGQGGGSVATAACCLAAVAAWWRRGDRAVLLALLAPFALSLAAAALRRYPYGGEARVAQHLAPMICLLAGLGAASLVQALPRPRDRARLMGLAVAVLVGLGAWSVARDCRAPYRSERELRVREFARRFWPAQSRGAELICARTDLGIRAPAGHRLAAALDLCYRAICLPRPIPAPRLEAVSADHPLRCVAYGKSAEQDPAFVAWEASLAPRFALRSVERFSIEWQGGRHHQIITLFEFVPRSDHPIPVVTRHSPWPPRSIATAPAGIRGRLAPSDARRH